MAKSEGTYIEGRGVAAAAIGNSTLLGAEVCGCAVKVLIARPVLIAIRA